LTPDPQSDWLEAAQQQAEPPGDEIMYVDVDGYEGPLDLLLDLARRQKVDLAHISVLALAEQYLAFIETVREKRIEIAADYLVMAAWLAYLKSRLMVPQAASDDEPTGEMMAALLQFRLKRLEAMRLAAQRLMNRSLLGQTVFVRGAPEPITVRRTSLWEASLFDLLKAYATQRERGIPTDYTPRERNVWSLQDARDILNRLIGDNMDWVPLDAYLAQYLQTAEERVTAIASTFASSLELARQGQVELRQTLAFGPLFVRRRKSDHSPTEN
jgi:segregation and condensation protein A